VPLAPFDLTPSLTPLPAAVATFLAAANARLDAYFAAPQHQAGIGFIPSDHEAVYRTLAAFRHAEPNARRFCEWGSGFGVIAGLAALLGFEVHGLEIDPALVLASRELLAAHGMCANIAHGSFLPEGDAASEALADLETRTVLGAADGYDELGRDLDDFEVVFAYPWPTEEELYCDVFRRRADYGAVLLTYSRTEGMRAYRKVPHGSRRPPRL
jgi:hypothetical protein